MGSVNERRRYIVTPPLIGWAHTDDDPCTYSMSREICARFCFILFCFVVAMFLVLGHDDFINWKLFRRHWHFVRGNPPVTSGFLFYVRLKKRPNQRWRCRWFETLWYPYNVTVLELMRLIYPYPPRMFLLAPERFLDCPKISKETLKIWIKSTSSTAKQTKTRFGSFYIWVQPMTDDVINRRLSLADPIYRMIPTFFLETTARPAL